MYPTLVPNPSLCPPPLDGLEEDKGKANRRGVSCGTSEGGRTTVMKKRWIIRSTFIGLLSLCVVGWVGSCYESIALGH